MKSILVVSTLFPNNNEPVRGTFVKETVLQLRKHFDIRVISPIPLSVPRDSKTWRMKAGIHRQGVIDGIEVWYPRYFMLPRVGRFLDGFFYSLSLLIFTKRFVDRYACDAVIVPFAYPDGFGMTLINFVLKKPMFIQVLGSDINRDTKFYLRRKMIVFALRRARKVFSVAYQLQERMVALGVENDRICTIPNGVDHRLFFPRDRHIVRARLGLPLEKKIVLFVGGLVDVKGVSYLIEAAAMLLKERKDLLFLIIGEGSRKETLRQMISRHHLADDVRLIGGKPRGEIADWMSSCDLLCLPSLSEGCPNVVIEALASGRPVVGTQVGDIPFLVKTPEGGYTVRPGDSRALAHGIERTLARGWDPDAVSRSVREFTWENVARRLCVQICREFHDDARCGH